MTAALLTWLNRRAQQQCLVHHETTNTRTLSNDCDEQARAKQRMPLAPNRVNPRPPASGVQVHFLAAKRRKENHTELESPRKVNWIHPPEYKAKKGERER